MMRFVLLAAFTFPLVAAVAFSESPPAGGEVKQPASSSFKRIDNKRLPNSYWFTPKVISGGQPAGEQAFADLAKLGVKTVISVDGAKPDVKTAEKHGLRYVHLPHSYDGISEERARELAKAMRDLPGPIYVHCHHGKHRSPAAVATACILNGQLEEKQGLSVLETAGTGKNYRGLYDRVGRSKKLDAAVLDKLAVEYPTVAKVPAFAEAMVALEHTHDYLKQIEAAGWKTPPDHPALEPAHQALLLREHFTELLRADEVKQHPADFAAMMRTSEEAGKKLETALTPKTPDVKAATALYAKITADCKACHAKYRDVPLDSKK